MDDSQYTLSVKEEVDLTYEDGFADGYSRAWQECWERMRQIAQTECTEPKEPKP